ncbi:hypothetical protein ABZ856_49225, partial [Streptomyces sp. NPDC047009]
LTVFRFPACTPDLNPAEGVWAHLKNSLGNLAPRAPSFSRLDSESQVWARCLKSAVVGGS